MRVDKSKWESKTFPQIGISQLGKTLDSKKNKGNPYPYLCALNVGNGTFNLSVIKEILLEDDELERYLVKRGDILICEGGETGRCAIWDSDEPIYYQNALHRVRLFDNIFNRFIMYYIHYYKQIGVIDRLSHGQTIKHFTQKDLKQLAFALPPLTEQKAIVSELDAVQEMIDGYKAQLADLDELAKSIYHSYIDNKNFTYVKFESICSKMMSGPFGTMLHKSDYVDTSGIPQINPQDIKGGVVVKDNIKFINPIKLNELKRFLLKENDIIIARRGDLSKCTIIKKEHINWLCGTGSCLVRITKVLPSIFYYWFTSDHIQTILNENVIGTTMPNLNKKKLQETLIPVPPLHLQQQFATKIEAIEKQKELVSQQLADAQTLFDSRMQYYFE
ncbi:MAG: restriction endonuclease subunit S [Prevotellaceae bacterium]|nr:restriction endonuclease subunit S [Prevotellaceae bacterium]